MVRSLRSITCGMLVGMGLTGAVLLFSDRHLPDAKVAPVAKAPDAKPFLGPGRANAAPVPTIGDHWLGVNATVTPPVKANVTPEPFQTGVGLAVARGGPGAEWGPVHERTTSAKPESGFAPDPRLFAVTPMNPMAATYDRRARRADVPGPGLDSIIAPAPPRQWRWDVGY